MTKGSKHNLGMALMYLRLAYQSMSKDQDEARRALESVFQTKGTNEALLRALAELVLEKTKTLEDA